MPTAADDIKLAPKIIPKYQVDTKGYDIIRGRRTNA